PRRRVEQKEKNRRVNAASSRAVTADRAAAMSSSFVAAGRANVAEALMRIAPPRTVAPLDARDRAYRDVFTAVLGGAMRSRAACDARYDAAVKAEKSRGADAAPSVLREEEAHLHAGELNDVVVVELARLRADRRPVHEREA